MACHRTTSLLAALALVVAGLGATAGSGATAAPAGPAAASPDRATKPEPGKIRYRATIRRTRHGIPHITAKDYASLGFGSGYATAETSICILADTLLTARGQRSRWLGADGRYEDKVTLDASNLQVDALVTDLRNRRVVEKLMADRRTGPGRETRAMARGYVAGVNRYLSKVGPRGVTDPACRGRGYLKQRVKPIDLWYGIYLANLLASTGVFLKEIVDAAPPSPTDPGLPQLPLRASDVDRDALLAELGRDPETPFGSNATAVGKGVTSTGRGMVLGNPHFPWAGRYRFTQQHLTIPGKYDVAGASLMGAPVVNIGWNNDVAWSHTVSTAYRFTPYEFVTAGPSTYLTDRGPRPIEKRTVKVRVRGAGGKLSTVTEDLFRTEVGYVIDAPAMLMPWGPASVWAIRDANGEHLRTLDSFHEMGKARSVHELLAAQDRGAGIPWVNTVAADRAGRVLYADHSVVPNVPDEMAQECMTVVGRVLQLVAGLPGLDGTRAGSSCAWRTDPDAQRPGILGPRNLPATVRRDWVANANDSYWLPNPAAPLEGYDEIIGCERCERTPRTRMVYRYVTDRIASGRKETPRSFRGHQHANRVLVAEMMRAGGDLDTVCRATGETTACAVLREWDGRSDTTSVGTHLFEEFVARLPASGVWTVPFDPADPTRTPRDLNELNPAVVQALRDAVASLRQRGVPLEARWGSLQVAGDRGAPPIGIGGGEGATGNANVVTSGAPTHNTRFYKPVTYGSSHIQAVSFLDRGRVDARTILTYGQSENPRLPWSKDQTRLFGKEQWVRFAWTPRQIREDLLRSYVVSGPGR